MITITHIANKDRLFEVAIHEYLKRTGWEVSIKALPQKTSNSLSVLEKQKLDTKLLLSEASSKQNVVVLDIGGTLVDTKSFGSIIQSSDKPIHFIIGGNYGFVQEQISSYQKISLSKMTFTLNLALLVLVEQIYRSYAIANNLKYHK